MVALYFYKLIQFLKKYVNPKIIKIFVVIYFCIAQKLLRKQEFGYKEVRKDIFRDNYKELDIIKDQNQFFITIKKLKLYIF